MTINTKHKQLDSSMFLGCGTSIGALVREAEHAESFKDFAHKLNIVLTEVNESRLLA